VDHAWEYPGAPVAEDGVLVDGRWRARAVDPARDTDGRTPLLAVGSNACAAVLARKLATVPGSLPVRVVRADGLGVGHSAHVSRRGYVPAAPFPSPGSTVVRVLLVDSDQLAAVDATEPTYDRVAASALGVTVPEHPEADVYVSRAGVLAPPTAPPLPLRSQAELVTHLRDQVPGLAGLVPPLDPAGWTRALAADARLRTKVGDLLRRTGWVREVRAAAS
jgi:hypothetical protein